MEQSNRFGFGDGCGQGYRNFSGRGCGIGNGAGYRSSTGHEDWDDDFSDCTGDGSGAAYGEGTSDGYGICVWEFG